MAAGLTESRAAFSHSLRLNDSYAPSLFGLAVCQHLAEGSELISIGGDREEKLVITATPLHWTVPVSIDEEALGATVYEPLEFGDDDEWDDDDVEVPEMGRAVNG